MTIYKGIKWFAIIAVLVQATGCASVSPVAYKDISSHAYLQQSHDENTIPYQYSENIDMPLKKEQRSLQGHELGKHSRDAWGVGVLVFAD